MDKYLECLPQIVSGLVVLIPLVNKLIQYVQKATREKNWNRLLKLTMDLMQEAEKKFTEGATKKIWVISKYYGGYFKYIFIYS